MPLTDLSDPDVLLREKWESTRRFDADGTPVLPPDYVAEAGPRVWVVDVRTDGEHTGATGHIPGVARMPIERIATVAQLLPAYTPVVLVCSDGARSATAARYLSALGMTTVAAMSGGMEQWRSAGFAASRDEGTLGAELAAPAPGNGSDGRPLTVKQEGPHLTKDAIAGHLGDPAKVRRVKLAALLIANQTSCVDGREDRAIIGTPGGDAGEFILGLAAVEKVTGQQVSLEHIPALTRAFADTFGGIYLHTDNGALNRLARSMRGDTRLESAVGQLHTIRQWETFLRRPPYDLRAALLDHLVEPAHVGCGHLKLAMTSPEAYEVRPAIIQAFFRAFYSALWDGAPDLEWVVLGGDHKEGAVVNVTLEGDLWPFSLVPMVAPAIGGVQMFVNHPEVVTYFRQQTSQFFSTGATHLLPVGKGDVSKLAEVVPELGGSQALATLKALAAGLPVFGVRFGADGKAEVSEDGTIPSP